MSREGRFIRSRVRASAPMSFGEFRRLFGAAFPDRSSCHAAYARYAEKASRTPAQIAVDDGIRETA